MAFQKLVDNFFGAAALVVVEGLLHSRQGTTILHVPTLRADGRTARRTPDQSLRYCFIRLIRFTHLGTWDSGTQDQNCGRAGIRHCISTPNTVGI